MPAGIYYRITANRVLGPHDISRYFDSVATGPHMKEYTVGELAKLCRNAEFHKSWVEKGWGRTCTARNRLGRSRRFFWALEVCLAGRKDR
jgi:hypothetical protein